MRHRGALRGIVTSITAVALGLAVTACGGGSDAGSTSTKPVTPSTLVVTVTPGATESAATQSAAGASPSAPATQAPQPPPGIPQAFPGAGGPAPAAAIQATAIAPGTDVAIIISKTGNIGCDLSRTAGRTGCGVLSMLQTRTMGETPTGPNWWVGLGVGGVPQVHSKRDAPYFPGGGAQVIEYGQQVAYGDNVCAAEEVGWTCWNTVDGHGIFMNRDTMSGF